MTGKYNKTKYEHSSLILAPVDARHDGAIAGDRHCVSIWNIQENLGVNENRWSILHRRIGHEKMDAQLASLW